ncbi:uncharacterized protein LOC125953411 isoform X1 [Anopheles darlingi]|uniref:uncharacterized protein LOC125953411 isoform X1 n=1 Tax=Anopheles darlingi TaxID=43151 RepID=UPI002100380B|nr:uncharacterized protein LOC125953411 isoform X1 [Anopheles darlingi]XP_049538951.1 uncharacterized protein LOC125953411 isoform X1 [Anopheles darlingi]XP_049538952.1 uncharacterized protein LOC125953411 isoform X1 [Anopheles darlingi]XP_049538953.1 uncharacterized protein LOC125953411 isoform X1 [Anopheles darlingi]
MVNKQYNVHNPKLHKTKVGGGGGHGGGTGSGSGGNSSPSPLRSSYNIISTRPDAGTTDEDRFSIESGSCGGDGGISEQSTALAGSRSSAGSRQLPPPPPPPRGHSHLTVSRRATVTPEQQQQQQHNGDEEDLYGRNIQFYGEGQLTAASGEVVGESPSHAGRFAHGLGGKELTISDIGRFQYILQMDREVGTPYSGYTDSANTLPSSPTPTSLDSHSHNRQSFNFWKAGSQSPLSASSSSSSFFRPSQRCLLYKVLKVIWRYIKWPLGLLMICALLGLVVYFLVVDRDIMSSGLLGEDGYEVDENLSIDFNDFTSTNDLHPGDHHYNGILKDKPKVAPGSGRTAETKFSFGLDNDLLAVFGHAKKPTVAVTFDTSGQSHPASTSWGTVPSSTERHETESASEELPAQVVKVTEPPIRKTSTISLKDYTKARVVFDDDDFLEADDGQSRLPQDVNGHPQQNGRVPEGTTRAYERVTPSGSGAAVAVDPAAEVLQRQKNVTIPSATTDASLYRTKVSPTLPILSRFEITTEGLKRFNVSEEGICQSTSLPLCRGVLPYDLTVPNNHRLSALEYEHFQYLINSKCSIRVAEFVCLALEPECRPTRMGTLTPCKRICKSILEPCAHIIASSEALTATFDCDSYPDSDDRNMCEDPTRLGKCYANEFRCADSSCIPLQWKCDNIKDCQGGEDESDCKQCERDEYRCMSNDKCIPDKWRCDQYEDCPDASDEVDCYYDEPTTFPTAYGSQREYPFVQVQVPNSPNGRPYITITNEDRAQPEADHDQPTAPRSPDYGTSEENDETDKYEPTAAENAPQANRHQGNHSSEENSSSNATSTTSTSTTITTTERVPDQTEAETGRSISLPKSLVNFQDSKEIMMTSDSENDFKISSTSRDFLTTAHVSPCPEGELRCVSGICISVSQLCDKVQDCADGADEAGCTYKE